MTVFSLRTIKRKKKEIQRQPIGYIKNGGDQQRKSRLRRNEEVKGAKAFEIFQRGPCQLKSHAFILFMVLYAAAADLSLVLSVSVSV